MLFNEPKLLKLYAEVGMMLLVNMVSVLFNEPKLLKYPQLKNIKEWSVSFSALQRAEIAEIGDW